MSALATQDGRAAERDRTADQLAVRSGEVAERDAALATLLSRLAVAIREDNREEVAGYAGAVDPHAVAELLVFKNSTLWGLIEVARNVLVFAPIALTWYGLSTATDAYQKLISARPDLVTRPFLLLWQEGFEAVGVLKFSTLAIIDASLIGVLIVLSLLIHYRAEIHHVPWPLQDAEAHVSLNTLLDGLAPGFGQKPTPGCPLVQVESDALATNVPFL